MSPRDEEARRRATARRGEALAADAVLAVSEKQLQAARQLDRRRRLPDFKALGYPQLERQEVVVRSDGDVVASSADFQVPFSAAPPRAFAPPPSEDNESLRGGGAVFYADAAPPREELSRAERVARRCRSELRGLGYDVLHWEDITRDDLDAAGCEGKLRYVLTRGGRGLFLLLTLLAVGAALAALRALCG